MNKIDRKIILGLRNADALIERHTLDHMTDANVMSNPRTPAEAVWFSKFAAATTKELDAMFAPCCPENDKTTGQYVKTYQEWIGS